MPVGIIPDISEQMCIGCALCVEICTTLGPDVLRVKPVEGWKRGKAFVFYPERCISRFSLRQRLDRTSRLVESNQF
jgi:Fe-S-cluster-containing hydrogenase component 2